MNSKPKSIDMGSLIQKVTKRARELLEKKSKPRTKGKSANGTSRYSKSKRQKLLIGGVSVKLDGDKKKEILNIIGIKTPQRMSGQAHLVELLKLKTIQKIQSEIFNYNKKIQEDTSRETQDNSKFTAAEATEVKKMEQILEDVAKNLKLLSKDENDVFNARKNSIKEGFTKDTAFNILEPIEKEIYDYNLFTDELATYKIYNIEKEITALNIFKLFYNLLEMNEDNPKVQLGGGIEESLKFEIDDKGQNIIIKTKEGDVVALRKNLYEDLLKENKGVIRTFRKEFQDEGIVEEIKKKSETTVTADLQFSNSPNSARFAPPSSLEEKMLGETESGAAAAKREELNIILTNEFATLKEFINNNLFGNKSLLYHKAFALKELDGNHLNLIITKLAEDFFKIREEKNKDDEKSKITKIKSAIKEINNKLQDVANYFQIFKEATDLNSFEILQHNGKNTLNNPDNFLTNLINIKTEYEYFKTKDLFKNPKNTQFNDLRKVGGNPVKYKSTGQVVHIMFQNKKYKRVIYVKEKRNTKYCKMNNEYILLSKLKVIE